MSKDVDVEKLRARFADLQYHGVVTLIDYLASSEAKGPRCIGSGTIGLGKIMDEIWVSEEAHIESAWFRTRSLYIGSNDGSVMPLEWLEKLSLVFDHVSAPAQRSFDEFCRALADFAQAKPVGNVEIYRQNGIFEVPSEVYHEGMSDEELEPYRVERGTLF